MTEQVIRCICESSQKIDWANIIMAVTGIINLGIVIFIFKKEQNNNKEKEEKSKKNSWYNLFKIKEETANLSNKIDLLKLSTEKFYNSEITEEEYIREHKEVENELLKFKNSFTTIVNCINPQLESLLTDKFQKIQDDFIALLSKSIGNLKTGKKISLQQIYIEYDEIKKDIIITTINVL